MNVWLLIGLELKELSNNLAAHGSVPLPRFPSGLFLLSDCAILSEIIGVLEDENTQT